MCDDALSLDIPRALAKLKYNKISLRTGGFLLSLT
jgi:hypothetical protein